MRLYIIRHGETQYNKKGLLAGQTDVKLNENGIKLAEVTAKGLEDVKFDLCITSPLDRAVSTAKIILGDRKTPMIYDVRIKEIDFGDFNGKSCLYGNLGFPREYMDAFLKTPYTFEGMPGGESIAQLAARTKDFYNDLINTQEYMDLTILISLHGCSLRAFMNNIYEDTTDFWHGCVPANCAVSVVEIDAEKNARIIEDDKIYYDPSKGIDYKKNE